MPRKTEDANEIKPKYFRVDDETASKIEQLSTEVFNSKNECLKALVQLYELEQSKKTMPGLRQILIISGHTCLSLKSLICICYS